MSSRPHHFTRKDFVRSFPREGCTWVACRMRNIDFVNISKRWLVNHVAVIAEGEDIVDSRACPIYAMFEYVRGFMSHLTRAQVPPSVCRYIVMEGLVSHVGCLQGFLTCKDLD